MSLAKKISLLVLSLIALIVFCVYSHINDFATGMPISTENKVETETKKPKIEKLETQDNNTQNKALTEVKVTQKLTAVPPVEKVEIKEDIEKTTEEVKKSIQKVEEEVVEKDVLAAIDKIVKKDDRDSVDNIDVKVTKKRYSLTKSNLLIQKEINSAIKKQRIIFKRLSTQVAPQSAKTIKKIATILKKYKKIKIEVAGHTDAKGADDVNEWVSLTRAKSVRKELIKLGINKNRITAKGYGESKPIVKNDPQGYSTINRRVELNIIEE